MCELYEQAVLVYSGGTSVFGTSRLYVLEDGKSWYRVRRRRLPVLDVVQGFSQTRPWRRSGQIGRRRIREEGRASDASLSTSLRAGLEG